MQNGFVESFRGRMRDELLNESLFLDLDHTRQLIGAWGTDYNTARPHSALGYKRRWPMPNISSRKPDLRPRNWIVLG